MDILIASSKHIKYCNVISKAISSSAKVRGTGIALRSSEYIKTKIENNNAIIAVNNNEFAGFCYIEVWGHGKYVAHSGLIVSPEYRGKGLAKKIKTLTFNHSKNKYPDAKIFGITTGLPVMKINYELGYKPVTFSELTDDNEFWKGCSTCKNYDVLKQNQKRNVPLHRNALQFKIKQMKKIILAYSGGLDTSYCLKKLFKEGNEVHAVNINTGGFTINEIELIKEKAIKMGAFRYKSIDAVQTYYNKIIKFLVFGNVLKNNTYPLSVSAERTIQALEIIKYAKENKATHIAHGSTGAGNDQVRFDMIFQIIAPEIKIITPIAVINPETTGY